jgi:hypothetical protein
MLDEVNEVLGLDHDAATLQYMNVISLCLVLQQDRVQLGIPQL